MFFSSSKTVDVLVRDHKELKVEIGTLEDLRKPLRERRAAFNRLVPNLISHSRREENVVYTYMKTLDKDLKEMALEGEEEHHIVDHLVEELQSSKYGADEWSAKGKVLSDLIGQHLEEEENQVFPRLQKNLDAKADEQLCKNYESGSIKIEKKRSSGHKHGWNTTHRA